MMRKAGRVVVDFATALVYLTAMWWTHGPAPRFSAAEVLEMSSRAFTASLEQAKLERILLRTEMAIASAESAAERRALLGALFHVAELVAVTLILVRVW